MSDKKAPTIKYYKRPEFYLIVLTALLWLAFLYKVIIFKNHNNDVETPITLKKETKDSPGKTPDKALIIKSRNKPNKNPPEKEESNQSQIVLEALRESLDKSKPIENLIIRGEAMTLIQKSGRNAKTVTELVIDNEKLKKLNADYMKALRK